ncbi:MAG: hypothetical protein ACI4UM_03745 [Succinivibrio sp.]
MKKSSTKYRNQDKLLDRIVKYVKSHSIPFAIGVLSVMFAAGSYLVISGYLQYTNTTKESYVVAGLKSMQEGNLHKAQTFLLQAGKNGAAEAYPYLAWISAKSGNFSKALEYSRECAKYKDVYGSYELMGYLALLGYGNAQGAGSAIYYFNEALKEYSEEYLKTHAPLLKMYERGIELCMNTSDYIRMVNESVSLGSKEALLYRGDIDFLGLEHDVSPASAAKSWEKAKAESITAAKSRLAGMLWHGYGCNRDYVKAMELYEDAAQKDDPVANYSIGLIKLRTQTKTSFLEGMRHLKNAAKKNYGPALTAVGVMALVQNRNNSKIIYASSDIFKQAYDCGDSTGGILYALMLMNGDGVATDQTEAFSILYDLKNRSVKSVDSLLKYFIYTKNINSRKLFNQLIILCKGIYLGDIAFDEGAPEAVKYHNSKNERAVSYFKSQSADRARFDDELIRSLGKNYVEKFDDPKHITIGGEQLIYPDMYEVLEMYNPTTGAKAFMPKMIMKIDGAIPQLPKQYDKYNIDMEKIEKMF